MEELAHDWMKANPQLDSGTTRLTFRVFNDGVCGRPAENDELLAITVLGR